MPLNKSHGIEASYITVHLYDILVINTRPWLCLWTLVSIHTLLWHNLYIYFSSSDIVIQYFPLIDVWLLWDRNCIICHCKFQNEGMNSIN